MKISKILALLFLSLASLTFGYSNTKSNCVMHACVPSQTAGIENCKLSCCRGSSVSPTKLPFGGALFCTAGTLTSTNCRVSLTHIECDVANS